MKPLTLQLLGWSLLCAVAGETHAQDNTRLTGKAIGIPNATPETNPPALFIEYPKEGQRIGQSNIRTLIRATDDTRVEYFRFSVNGTSVSGTQGDWYWAPGTPAPWGASIELDPGTNTFEVVCVDYFGNAASASVTFVSAPGSGVTLDIASGGRVTPNYQDQSLDLGKTYSMTAHPAKGFHFDGWSGSVSNRRPKVTFIMQPDLFFTARFTDVSRPLNIIKFPRANSTVTSTNIIGTGKAADNSAVTNVYYQLNDSGWETATTTNAWTNWETSALSPGPGRNVIESYAVDDSGLPSRTNRVKFRY